MTLKVCPWCGEVPERLELSEGSTYRWAIVTPSCCGAVMGEIRRASYPKELGSDTDLPRAIEWWNDRKEPKP